jgi:hypothetical protein
MLGSLPLLGRPWLARRTVCSAQMKLLDEALAFSGRRYPDWMMATIDG